MGRRADDDGVQAVQIEQLFIVLEGLRTLALEFLQLVGGAAEVLAVDVTDGSDFGAADFQGRLGVDHAVPADADDSHLQRPVLSQAVGGAGQGHRPRRRGSQKSAPIALEHDDALLTLQRGPDTCLAPYERHRD